MRRGAAHAHIRETREEEEAGEMGNGHVPYGPYERWLKRPLDVALALMVLALFWWLYLLVAVLVRVKLGKPVLHRAKRPGKDGEIFTLYKFRSMSDARDAKGELLPDVERLTKFGRILRAASLDELPEVMNILRGEMSFVGPRPLALSYLPYYTAEENRRHDVLPGITGNAQVHGRNSIEWSEKFQYDLAYVDHITFWGDVEILFRTVLKVFEREGIGQGEEAPQDFNKVRIAEMEMAEMEMKERERATNG